jgi:hypothetical protein
MQAKTSEKPATPHDERRREDVAVVSARPVGLLNMVRIISHFQAA